VDAVKLTSLVATFAYLEFGLAPLASGNLITDGGFENHQAVDVPERYFAGSAFGGWLVGGQGSDHVDLWYDPLNAIEGNQYLEMIQSGGDVSQVVGFQVGHAYELHIIGSAIYTYGASRIDIVASYPADTLLNNSVVGSAVVPENPQVPDFAPPLTWHEYQFTFAAQAAQERLFFRNGSTGHLLIDNIRLTDVTVPEPSSIALVSVAAFGLGVRLVYRGRRASRRPH
jgi:hypothetical protein